MVVGALLQRPPEAHAALKGIGDRGLPVAHALAPPLELDGETAEARDGGQAAVERGAPDALGYLGEDAAAVLGVTPAEVDVEARTEVAQRLRDIGNDDALIGETAVPVDDAAATRLDQQPVVETEPEVGAGGAADHEIGLVDGQADARRRGTRSGTHDERIEADAIEVRHRRPDDAPEARGGRRERGRLKLRRARLGDGARRVGEGGGSNEKHGKQGSERHGRSDCRRADRQDVRQTDRAERGRRRTPRGKERDTTMTTRSAGAGGRRTRPRLILVAGAPCSGRRTWMRANAATLPPALGERGEGGAPTTAAGAADDARTSPIQEVREWGHRTLRTQLQEQIDNGRSVVLRTTLAGDPEADAAAASAAARGYRIECVFVATPDPQTNTSRGGGNGAEGAAATTVALWHMARERLIETAPRYDRIEVIDGMSGATTHRFENGAPTADGTPNNGSGAAELLAAAVTERLRLDGGALRAQTAAEEDEADTAHEGPQSDADGTDNALLNAHPRPPAELGALLRYAADTTDAVAWLAAGNEGPATLGGGWRAHVAAANAGNGSEAAKTSRRRVTIRHREGDDGRPGAVDTYTAEQRGELARDIAAHCIDPGRRTLRLEHLDEGPAQGREHPDRAVGKRVRGLLRALPARLGREPARDVREAVPRGERTRRRGDGRGAAERARAHGARTAVRGDGGTGGVRLKANGKSRQKSGRRAPKRQTPTTAPQHRRGTEGETRMGMLSEWLRRLRARCEAVHRCGRHELFCRGRPGHGGWHGDGSHEFDSEGNVRLAPGPAGRGGEHVECSGRASVREDPGVRAGTQDDARTSPSRQLTHPPSRGGRNTTAGSGGKSVGERLADGWTRRLRAAWSEPRQIGALRMGIDIDGVLASTGWKTPPWELENGWEDARLLDAEGLRHAVHMTEAGAWETYAITARPTGPGRTVQAQTRRWLERHGAGMLSVIVEPGNRAVIARALDLDWLVDDNFDNCTTTALETDTRVVWVDPTADAAQQRDAQLAGCLWAENLADALDLIEE